MIILSYFEVILYAALGVALTFLWSVHKEGHKTTKGVMVRQLHMLLALSFFLRSIVNLIYVWENGTLPQVELLMVIPLSIENVIAWWISLVATQRDCFFRKNGNGNPTEELA